MIVAVDIETVCNVSSCTGFNNVCGEEHALDPWRSRITVIGVYGEGIKRTFRSLNDFKEFINNQNIEFIGHNFKFDIHHLYAHGVEIPLKRWVGDTQLMAYVLTEKIPDDWLSAYASEQKRLRHKGRKASKHSLKTLAPYFLDVPPFWETEYKDSDEYVLKDVEYTYRLHDVLQKKLEERNQFSFYKEKQLAWTKILLRAEMRGIRIDTEEIRRINDSLLEKAREIKRKLDEIWHDAHVAYTEKLIEECSLKYSQMSIDAGSDITEGSRYHKLYIAARAKLKAGVDYDSPKQMLWLLRDYYGYNCTSLDGKEGTGSEILERLSNEGHQDVALYLELRRTNKILCAFLPSYMELQTSGSLHPIFNPDSTRTGRTSSAHPNLQQVPAGLKRIFKAREGCSLIAYDASQIEAKLIALYTNDPALYEIISSGASLHDYNTKLFFGIESDVPLERIKEDYSRERATTKNVGFALFYGAGANRIRITFANKGYHLTDYECRDILQRFRSTYRVATSYQQDLAREMEAGAVVNNLLGRPLKIFNPEDAYMTAFNTIIQSSASDLNLEAARRTQEAYDDMALDAHVIGFIHDSIIVEAKNEDVTKAEIILKDKMTDFDLNCDLGPIKLAVEGGVSSVWEK